MVFLSVLAALFGAILNPVDIRVTLSHGGQVRGAFLQSDQGREVLAFRGIPFAEPPVGEQRFKAPVAKAGWKGVFDASKDGPSCVQMNMFAIFQPGADPYVGEEDCLHINVYTTQLPRQHPDGEKSHHSKMAVFVFLHGGGFRFGDSRSNTYGPSWISDAGVVLVAMNYRVGLFGFLSTGDEASPGNYGLMDQTLALKWVRDNIAQFGGDPDRVTIFGESAGGASITYHLISPLSAGLFHGAIAMSGTALCSWAFQPNPLPHTLNLAVAAGCSNDSTTVEMVECLRRVEPFELARLTNTGPITLETMNDFLPTVDGTFLPAHPQDLFRNHETLNKVPVMSGVTKDEGAVFLLIAQMTNPNVSISYTEVAENTMSGAAQNNPEIREMIRKKYFDIDMNNKTQVRKSISKLIGDSAFVMPHLATLEAMSTSGAPTYTYSYDYAARTPFPFLVGEPGEVSHGADLFMLFNIEIFGFYLMVEEDRKMARTVTSLWANFAKTGNPTPEEDETTTRARNVYHLPHWDPNPGSGKLNIYHINDPMTQETHDVRQDDLFHFWTKEVPQAFERAEKEESNQL